MQLVLELGENRIKYLVWDNHLEKHTSIVPNLKTNIQRNLKWILKNQCDTIFLLTRFDKK